MTIVDQINRLNNAKAAIKQSIKNKGVAVSDEAKLDEYPALIDKIQTGSGGGGADPIYENIWNAITVNNTDYHELFSNSNMSELDLSTLDTSNVTTMAFMFNNCNSLSYLNISNFNTGNVMAMNQMFYCCYLLNYLEISSWDVCNVTDMNSMFQDCGLYSLDLSGWYNTYNVQDMSYMFSGCGSLSELNLSNFDMSSVYNTDDMFANCYCLSYLHLDYCSYETVEKIITSSNFPEGNSGTIYCSEDVYNNLTPPGSWMFEIVY